MRKKARAATDLAKVGTKFSSNSRRFIDETVVDMEDGGRMRRMFT